MTWQPRGKHHTLTFHHTTPTSMPHPLLLSLPLPLPLLFSSLLHFFSICVSSKFVSFIHSFFSFPFRLARFSVNWHHFTRKYAQIFLPFHYSHFHLLSLFCFWRKTHSFAFFSSLPFFFPLAFSRFLNSIQVSLVPHICSVAFVEVEVFLTHPFPGDLDVSRSIIWKQECEFSFWVCLWERNFVGFLTNICVFISLLFEISLISPDGSSSALIHSRSFSLLSSLFSLIFYDYMFSWKLISIIVEVSLFTIRVGSDFMGLITRHVLTNAIHIPQFSAHTMLTSSLELKSSLFLLFPLFLSPFLSLSPHSLTLSLTLSL